MRPSVKKEVVKYLRSTFQVGVRLATKVVGISRSSWYYQSKLDDSEVIEKLNELTESHPTRGFENYYFRLRREGYKWSRNRVLRIYREMGLVRRTKRLRKLPESLKRPLHSPLQLNEVWSMDFMSDTLEDGRPFRILNVIDDCNRECLVCEGSISFPSLRVIRVLDQIAERTGYPKYLRTDNGPEFLSKDYKEWAEKNHVICVYSAPGKPMQNGFVERFNRTFREDVLDAYLFNSTNQFNVISEYWKDDYNNNHPHESLGRMSPKDFQNRHQPLGVDTLESTNI